MMHRLPALLLGLLLAAAGLGPLVVPPTAHAFQYSVTVKDARLDAVETAVGTSPILKIREGSAPSSCADSDTGDVLATMTLPADWMANASSGTKAKSGTWEDSSADDTGTAGHFRIYASDGTTCHIQGTVTATGGGGDIELDNTSIAAGQSVTITNFTITSGN